MEYRRIRQPGGCYFFTVVTEGRRPLLIEHIDRLRRAFRHVRRRHPFRLEAIVVLPDHLHALWVLPPGDHDYSTRWSLIKRTFSSSMPDLPTSDSRRRQREKGIWQRRFWEHCIRDEQDWSRHLDYIHYNPIKHGYVERVAEWPFSSFHRLVERGWYPEDWGGDVSEAVLSMDFE